MADDKKQYDVFKGLLNGSQANTLSDAILIKEVQIKTCEALQGANSIYILHDPCDIRKPSAPKMENIGKVMSLGKDPVNGYKTFNSVAIDVNKQGVNLLSHTLYSTGLDNFVHQKVLANIEKADANIQEMVAKEVHINTAVVFNKHLKESNILLKKNNPDINLIHVLDREFDDIKIFNSIISANNDFIIRLKSSRLSNELITTYTPKGKISKKKSYQKLIEKNFKNKDDYLIEALTIKGKLYHNVRCVLEWESLILEGKNYSVVRIGLWNGNKLLFKNPMMLLTNQKISSLAHARSVYKGYILRFKIEVVFRFLKQNLGWEDFQVRDFESIKNLLAISFFLLGYFKEMEEELKKHPLALFLCNLALSKGKITLFYLLDGLTKAANFLEVSIWMRENDITEDNLKELMHEFQGLK
jgi:hypothetical protein